MIPLRFARRRLALLPALALPILLASCGGGGGSSKPTTVGVAVTTNWTGATAQSERISIVNLAGTVTSTVIVGTSTTPTISSIQAPTGAYLIKVELNSGANFTGTTTGVLTQAIANGSTALQVAAGGTASTLRISPSSLDLKFGATYRLGVAGATTAGVLTFVPAGSVAFTKSGTTATVSSDGLVTASGTAGTTAVTATSGALTATANVNVASSSTTQSKWTVMVFLNASNDLFSYALPNVKQMAQVAYNSDVRFVLQWKESKTVSGNSVDFDGTRRYLVTTSAPSGSSIPGKLIQTLPAGVDMGKTQTLSDFVTWTKANYPADRYALVVWDHGDGWAPAISIKPPATRAISFDAQSGSVMEMWDLPSALASQPVDILSFDACLMQMLEDEDELKSCCSYLACSEENTPGPGYPYDRIFKAFADSPSSDTLTLSQAFVTGHVGAPLYQDQPVTQSVVDSSKVTAVSTAVDALALTLIAERANLLTEIPAIRHAMQVYGVLGDGYNYYDLVDLANHLIADNKIPADVQAKAQVVINAVNAAVKFEGHSSQDTQSHGIAIDFSPSTATNLNAYSNLSLAKTTHWLDWLKVAP